MPLRITFGVHAQNPELMTPEQNVAKAKQLLDNMIQAIGGEAYLAVKDFTRTGRIAYFDSKGDLGGFTKIWEFTKLPDKSRTEYSPKRNVIDVYNGDRAWTLDRGGVREQSPERGERYKESLKRDMDLLLRIHRNDPGLILHYAGSDLMDMNPVDLIEFTNAEHQVLRIAILQTTKLPLRVYFLARDKKTNARIEDVKYFSNYQPVQGIQTPMQVVRYRNDMPVYQVFYTEVQYNTGLSDTLFTKEGLDQTWKKLGRK